MTMKFYPLNNVIDKDLVRICVKYNKDTYLYSEGKCKDTATQDPCGLDFCVAKTEKCPYNELAKISAITGTPEGLTTIKVGGEEYGFYKSGDYESHTPFIDFETEPEYPCWEKSRTGSYDSKLAYPLLKVQPIGCSNDYGQARDYFFDMQVPMNEIKLYEKNNIMDKVKGLPFWDQYIKDVDNLRLYSEKQIKHTYGVEKCHDIDEDSIEQLRQKSKSLAKWIHGLAIAVLVFAILIIIVGIIFFFLRKSLVKKNPVRLMYIFAAIIVLLALWGFIVYLCLNCGSNSLEKKISNVKNQKDCFPDT